MAEQRSIAYKSLGFTLGLGGLGVGTSTIKAANSSFLDTLLSSVPAAKALLPTLVPDLTKPCAAAGGGTAGQRNEGLPSPELAPQKKSDQPVGAAQAHEVPQKAPAGAMLEVEVISLLSDSESGRQPGETPAAAQTTAISPVSADDGGKGAGSKPISAEFIPLPETGPTVAIRAAPSVAAGAASPESADALAEEENIRRLGERPYWMSYVSRIDSPLLRLHQELVELCELVQPTPEEALARREAVAAVAEVVRSIWPHARCEIFGSYATGLYVPTSDIDLVILDSGCGNVQSGLKALATSLGKRQVAQKLQVVGKARVPIVKFETVEYGNLAFDVSFDVANGPQAAQLVTEMTSSWPMMRPLILCLKLFLQQRELNEVYTGGIGSYALITLVAAFLQLHTSRRPKAGGGGGGGGGGTGSANGGKQQQSAALPVYGTVGDAALPSRSGGVEPGLGTLLVDFFRFYGRVVNTIDVGVSCAAGGQFFRKVDKEAPTGPHSGSFDGWLNRDRSHLLAVEDPKDPDNDVCRNSFNIMRVKTAFEYAYQMLTAPARRDESLLARILRLGPILASRPRPRVPHLRELGYYSQPPGLAEAARRERREPRSERKQRREKQHEGEVTPPGEERGEKEGGQGGGTPGRGGGSGGGARKRGRERSAGGPGEEGEGTGGGKRSRTATPTAVKGQGQRDEQKEQRKEQRKQRRSSGGGGSGDGGGNSGGSGGGGAQKLRREEAAAPSPAAAACGDRTPAPAAKRARVDWRQQQQEQGGGRSRDTGNKQPPQQQEQERQQPKRRHNHNGQHTQRPASQPLQQPRRAALMHVTVQPQPAPAAPAPVFHPGYAPPPAQQSHRHHNHHHSRQHQSRGGGDHSHHQSHESHHHHHHNHHNYHHHGNNRPHDGYSAGDARGGGGYGGGASGGGGYVGGDQGGYGRGPEGQGWRRAPILVPQQQQQQLRGPQHNHAGSRTHVFFD